MIEGCQASETGDCPAWLEWLCDLFDDEEEPPWAEKNQRDPPNIPSTPEAPPEYLGELDPIIIDCWRVAVPMCSADGRCDVIWVLECR